MTLTVDQKVEASAKSNYPANVVLADGRTFNKVELWDNPSFHPGKDFGICVDEDKLTIVGANYDEVVSLVLVDPFDGSEISEDHTQRLYNAPIYD